MDLQWPEWDQMIGKAFVIEKDTYEKWNESGNGVPSGKVLGAYEEIIRKAYLDTGNCTEQDITKFCGLMATKLQGEYQDYIVDGFMKWEKFQLMMMKDKVGYIEVMFKEYDLNDDGEITQEERDEIVARVEKENPVHTQKMKEFFSFMIKNFDTDGDGNVSKKEFLDGVEGWMYAKAEKEAK